MAALHIRDISDRLMKRLKVEAAKNGETLREYVIGELGGDEGRAGHRAKGADWKNPVHSVRGRERVPVRVMDGDVVSGVRGFGKPPVTLPRANVCVNCDHAKSKHGGFGGACQEDGCMCGKFE